MKRIIPLILVAAMALCFSACSNNSSQSKYRGDNMTLEEIMTSISDGIDLPATQNSVLTPENFSFYLFIEPIDGAEALANEAMINAIAHSVVLLRLPNNADAEAVAKEIRTNADPRKWICVEAEKTTVTVHNKTILLVMSSEDVVDEITANFDSLYQPE